MERAEVDVGLFTAFDEALREARTKTEEDVISRFLEHGFTKEDYKEARKVEPNNMFLWMIVPTAAKKGMKPKELLAKVKGKIVAHLTFPSFVLRDRRDYGQYKKSDNGSETLFELL